jgi:hypothetical protein
MLGSIARRNVVLSSRRRQLFAAQRVKSDTNIQADLCIGSGAGDAFYKGRRSPPKKQLRGVSRREGTMLSGKLGFLADQLADPEVVSVWPSIRTG